MRRGLRRRRRLGIGLLLVGGVVVLAGIWIGVTALLARTELSSVRAEIHTLRAEIDAGDFTAASRTAKSLKAHAHRAHEYTTGPAWALAAHVPLGGAPLRTARGIAAAADDLSRSALPTLITARDTLDPKQLRSGDGAINLAPIERVAPSLASADATTSAVTARVARLPRRTWLGTIDHARNDVLTQLQGLARSVRTADLAAQTVPELLGAHGTRHYFVTFQNDAEARGTGGLPGAFGIATADAGKVTFTKFYNDNTLDHVAVHTDFGADYDELYLGAHTTDMYVNSNLGPNFPYAAQIWVAMWQKYSGQHLDGAMTLDPTALSYLMQVTGPVTLQDGTQVTSGNVVALTQSTAYARFPDRDRRRAFLRDVAATVGTQIAQSRASLHDFVDAASRAASERRLLVWSGDPHIEALLEQTSLSGEIPETSAPFAGLSVVNDGGNKLDYYLDRSLTYQSAGCGALRDVTVTVQLTNNAPASGLPGAVTSRTDKHSYPIEPGDNRLEVSYYATSNAQLQSASLDGTAVGVEIGAERQHPVYRLDIELPRGTTRTVVLHLQEPASSAAPIVLRQPLVRPLTVDVRTPHC